MAAGDPGERSGRKRAISLCCFLASCYKDQAQTSPVSGRTQFGDQSLHRPRGMKREGKEKETTASTSSSHDDKPGRVYEVFLNFRGPDTRFTIADCLYNDMIRAGINVFKDNEELQFGEEIEGGLLQAINDSKIYIPIFSKDYASSKWCLRELARIVELLRDNNEKVILPIFYDVDADDVKLKTELYRKALQKHKSDSGKDLVKWEEALREVARIRGRNLKDHGLDELKSLMVKEVSSLLWTSRTNTLDHLVGIKEPMDDVMKKIDLRASDVRYIVIHGMGGIGKTTLADVVFKQISPQFQDHCCFLKDVRTHDILDLQKKMLFDILKLRCADLCDTQVAYMIKMRFRDKKVLVVLDDIDNQDQIMRLAGEPNWFDGGSRIIITTRNIGFLVKEDEDGNIPVSNSRQFSIYDMPEMKWHDALELFCERALGRAKPPPNYVDISNKLINVLGRLPLALDVVGSTLRGKCQSTWENILEKLKKVMNKDVKEKLMISYKALEPYQQEIYLDIACFFINRKKTIAIKYWDAIFGYPTEIEVKTLVHMSLIKIIDNDELWMHDQLRDLGRDIVHPDSRESHFKGSRLWSPKDAFPVVQRKMGTENIVALNLGIPEPDVMYRFKPKQFARLVKLRFLELDHGNFEGDFRNIFSNLRWLSWSNCPLEVQATNFGLKNLAVLILTGDNITENWGAWSQIMVAEQLRVLKLKDCPFLRKTPEFSSITRLERLILTGCTGLVEIGESIGNLQHLDYLKIRCDAIESLPESIGGLTSLTKLTVESQRLSMLPNSIVNLVHLERLILICEQLRKLPNYIGGLESLLELDIQRTSIGELPYSIGDLKRLKILRIPNEYLENLPDSIGGLQSLLKLDLSCSKIKSLPDRIRDLKKLEVLNLSGSRISELPKTIGRLENLEMLTAFDSLLEGEIPSEIGTLSSLKILDLSFCRISGLPTTINQLTNLQRLELKGCESLQQLPELPKSLSSLRFPVDSLTTVPDLSNLTNLDTLAMDGTPARELNIAWLERLRALRELTLPDGKVTLPPTDLSSLSQLQHLSISYAAFRSLTGLPSSLQKLFLGDVQAPMDWSLFTNLENLEFLSIVGYSLGEIRFEALGELRKFRSLSMWYCPLLKTLPVLPCLKEIEDLNLSYCPELTEIQGFGELKSLEVLGIRNCDSLILTESDLSNLPPTDRRMMETPARELNIAGLGRLRAPWKLILTGKMTLPPTDLSSLSQLYYLDISHCNFQSLTRLPSSLKILLLRDVEAPIRLVTLYQFGEFGGAVYCWIFARRDSIRGAWRATEIRGTFDEWLSIAQDAARSAPFEGDRVFVPGRLP